MPETKASKKTPETIVIPDDTENVPNPPQRALYCDLDIFGKENPDGVKEFLKESAQWPFPGMTEQEFRQYASSTAVRLRPLYVLTFY